MSKAKDVKPPIVKAPPPDVRSRARAALKVVLRGEVDTVDHGTVQIQSMQERTAERQRAAEDRLNSSVFQAEHRDLPDAVSRRAALLSRRD